MSLKDKEELIRSASPPRIVFIGSSYVGRLKEWHDQLRFEDESGLFQYVLSHSCYAYSGGATWENLWDRINGRRLPAWQCQGDTYGKIIKDKSYKAQYCFVICGSNSLDRVNDDYYHELKNSTRWESLVSSPYGPSKHYQKNHKFDRFERGLLPLHPTDFDENAFFEKASTIVE